MAIKQLDVAAKSFTAAQQAVAEAQFPPLVGPQGAFRDLTLPRFQQFLADCSTKGAGCLPPEEVAVVERLLRAAGVSFTGTATVGTMIAQFDAEGGDIGGREGALFAPAGVLNLAELLHRSVQNSVASNGPWLKINLDDSPVVITSRTRVGGTSLPLPQLPVNASTLPNLGPTTLSWVNTAGAVQYQVQVVPVGNDGPGINLIIGDPATVASGAFVIAPPVFGQGNYIILPGATYTWRVRTTSNAGSVTENDPTWGPWSEMRSFTTPRPTAGSIRDFKAAFNNGTATVSWQDQN
ncbi:MAG: hypothetical protein NTZ05_02910, partial [Chloroflexi bacterium]|nr:hypothetical protein [Chloroflexota bacterium]